MRFQSGVHALSKFALCVECLSCLYRNISEQFAVCKVTAVLRCMGNFKGIQGGTAVAEMHYTLLYFCPCHTLVITCAMYAMFAMCAMYAWLHAACCRSPHVGPASDNVLVLARQLHLLNIHCFVPRRMSANK